MRNTSVTQVAEPSQNIKSSQNN